MEQICQEKGCNIPNALTVSRILMVPAAVYFYSAENTNAALFIYLLAMLTDALDGFVARRTNQITTLGKLLDPLADKLWLLTMLTLFFIDGMVSGWVLALLIAKEAILIIGSAAAVTRGITVQALPIGKAATAVFTASITARFAGFSFAADAAMYAAVMLSIAAMLWYSWVLAARLSDQRMIRHRV